MNKLQHTGSPNSHQPGLSSKDGGDCLQHKTTGTGKGQICVTGTVMCADPGQTWELIHDGTDLDGFPGRQSGLSHAAATFQGEMNVNWCLDVLLLQGRTDHLFSHTKLSCPFLRKVTIQARVVGSWTPHPPPGSGGAAGGSCRGAWG